MDVVHNYEVDLSWQSARRGMLSSPVLPSKIEVATPPEFPKGMPGIWSPEHLFVAAVSSCLMTTFLAIAENSNLAFESFECRAVGKLEKIDGKYLISEITLKPEVILNSTDMADKARRVIEMSEKACLISNSIKTTVILEPRIVTPQIVM